MECSSNCVFEVYFSKKQAIARIGFRPGFAPKALNWAKTMEIQAVHSTCITVHLRFEPQLRCLFGPFFKFRIARHCTVYHKIAKHGSSTFSTFSEWTVENSSWLKFSKKPKIVNFTQGKLKSQFHQNGSRRLAGD